MKNRIRLSLLLTGFSCLVSAAEEVLPKPLEPIVTDAAKIDMDGRTKQLQELRFGMFVCWSLSHCVEFNRHIRAQRRQTIGVFRAAYRKSGPTTRRCTRHPCQASRIRYGLHCESFPSSHP